MVAGRLKIMNDVRTSEWRKLTVNLTELSLDTTLQCGQSFRWKKLKESEWTCALHGRVISLKQDPGHLLYKSTWPCTPSIPTLSCEGQDVDVENVSMKDDTEDLLRRYFNLGPNLTDLCEQWSKVDLNFKTRAPKFMGVRIMKQDAWEALICFICSSNNNISRISQMVNNLCLNYGPLIGHIHGQAFHDFPSPESLTGPEVELQLKKLGFGYRARYIARTAMIVTREKPPNWLNNLSNTELRDGGEWKPFELGGRLGYRRAHEELLTLQGVGPKVADCVCLMGLGWGESVPVDTHVWQIAQRDYKFGKGKHKSLTKATYEKIGNHFRMLWGAEAGWAHSILFAGELKVFSIRNVEATVTQSGIAIKEEDGVVIHETVVRKREAPKEVMIKDEVVDSSGGRLRTSKRSRLAVCDHE